jgi:hypothetical protein
MHAVLRRRLRRRQLAAQRLKSNLSLKSAEYRFRLPVIWVRPSSQGEPSLGTCPNFRDHLNPQFLRPRGE